MVPYFDGVLSGQPDLSQRVDARNPFADPGFEPDTDSSTYPSRTVESTSVNLSLRLFLPYSNTLPRLSHLTMSCDRTSG